MLFTMPLYLFAFAIVSIDVAIVNTVFVLAVVAIFVSIVVAVVISIRSFIW